MKSLKLTRNFVFSGTHFIAGIMMFVVMIWASGRPLHLGLLGLLSIGVSYGLNRMKRWSLYLLMILFFSGITFGTVTIYSSVRILDQSFIALSFEGVLVLYMAFLVISFLDALSHRRKLE